MLRVITIVFISFALSACRTSSDGSDSAPTSTQSTEPTYSQLTSTANAVYTAQPVSPPKTVIEVTYEDVSVTLEWAIPLQRENGDLLSASDLAGYIIEYSSRQSGPLAQERVQDGQSNSHTLSLPPGAYQFRVIAVDSNDVMSKPSDWINADLA